MSNCWKIGWKLYQQLNQSDILNLKFSNMIYALFRPHQQHDEGVSENIMESLETGGFLFRMYDSLKFIINQDTCPYTTNITNGRDNMNRT